MSYPTGPLREHPSTYFVQDRSNLEEMHRLDLQDKMMTDAMGGVLEDVLDPTSLRYVLDVGCGTGGWLIEMARTYPSVKTLVGVDISSKMMEYAHSQADSLGLGSRVQFKTMDALRILEFPTGRFDLVNQRAAGSWLRTWEWRKILTEYRRITRPGSIIRIVEPTVGIESNSPALNTLWDILLQAFYNSGRLFKASSDGIISELVSLMTKYGIRDVQTRIHTPVYRAGTASGQWFSEDMTHLYTLLLPFFQKWVRVPSDYEEIYRQALEEMQQPDFIATWPLCTTWGIRGS